MKIIRPITITDAMLISSTVPEPDTGDPAVWASGTNYAIGETVRNATTHLIYSAVQASGPGNGGAVDPTTDTDAAHWSVAGGVNKWAMFDNYVSTQTTEAASPLTATIEPGICDALYLYGMVGETATVTMTDGDGGPTVYSATLDLLVPKVGDWYSYYFEPYRQMPVFVLTDIPPYLNGRVTLSVTASAGPVACGMMLAGRTFTLGETKYGVQAGIRDYSRKNVDETTGFTSLEKRRFAKTLRASVRLNRELFAEVHEQLEAMRATPIVWVGDSTGDIQPLIVYGFYRDFYLVVGYPNHGLYNIEVEGMV